MDAAIFLDRDNTLIHNDGDLGDPDAVVLIQGAASAVASLRGLGYRIVVVSNQGGVARGKFEESDVDAVNRRINDLIHSMTGANIDRFYYCPYHPEGTVEKYRREHPWRKPQPGMILQAAKDMKLDLARSWTIGDALRDIQAGAAAGTRTILLTAGHSAERPAEDPPADDTADSLIEAVRLIAQQRSREAVAAEPTTRQRQTLKPPAAPPPPDVPSARTPPPPANRPELSPNHATAQPTAELSPPPADTLVQEPPEPTDPPETAEVTESDSESKQDTPNLKRTPPHRGDATETLLRQILQEMRDQRELDEEFSYTTVMAIILQMLAAVFLLAAFYFGWDNQDLFIRWMGGAILIQMATIAMLLFGR